MAEAPDVPSTRAQLLQRATDLIETQGFCAFSYADLARTVGIRKPSIHHHFPAKADLGVAVVEELLAEVRAGWAELERRHPSARARLAALFACVREKARSGDRICPVGALQAELNALPPPVRAAIGGLAAAYHETLAAWLEEGRRAGELAFPGSSEAMAQVVVCVMQAGLQRQRSNPGETVDAALAQLERLIGL